MHSKIRYVVLALLVLIPSFVNLGVPIYNRETPELFGLPFFYWFQTLWLVACTGFYLVYSKLVENKP
ncbi:MAG TPA: DUF3311 domain-containing protein [Candidatus Nitrosotalea sp.]|nr:DUF3311 domain-containing protein [Candidatus Nitrosotalea sp.]